MRHTTISLNQNNLKHNLTTLKQQTTAKLLAMVKADAYGHHAHLVVPACDEANGFGVACMSEAMAVMNALKDHRPTKDNRPIVLIEGVFDAAEWQRAIHHNFMTVIHHQTQLEYAQALHPAPNSHTNTIWLKLNTGMNRLGFNQKDAINACDVLIKQGYRVILTSHFACADNSNHPINHTQIKNFEAVFSILKNKYPNQIQGSLCNSAGFFNFRPQHFDWVRIGIALYGSSPIDQHAQALNLKAVMTLSAKIIAIHQIKQGEAVGYGSRWHALQNSRIGIISMGYGDGYPRMTDGAVVLINNQIAPIVGCVSMDMIAVDISAINANIDDEVILWGEGLSVDTVAKAANTLSYELFCRLTNRPTRILI